MKIGSIIILLLLAIAGYGQSVKYDRESLSKDLSFIVEKIKKAHNNPFTCCTEAEFDQETEAIRQQLKDSMEVKEFIALVNPLFKKLDDEHARIFAPGTLKTQRKEMAKSKNQSDLLHYEKAGKMGVLTINSFLVSQDVTLKAWNHKIDSIFSRIHKDKVRKLVIDISHNTGGNSTVGDILIAYFSDKEYKTYSLTWKRSDEYLALMKQYGWQVPAYEKLECGEYLTSFSKTNKPQDNPVRFRGEVWLAVGKKTFSSAMIFATVVKDNQLARLIGEQPEQGHPNHFGEMVFLQTPALGVEFGFGVKRFIRPSGQLENNVLEPDKKVDLSKIKTASDWKPYLRK